jgi:hypothetical protein
MARIKSHRRRGRPRKLHAKRRATTRIGRRTGYDPVDEGSPELVARKKIAANGSGAVVELTDHVGILAAHGLVDVDGLMTLRTVAIWFDRVRVGHGLHDGAGTAGLWAQIVSGARGGRMTAPITAKAERTRADRSWARICGLYNFFAAAKALDVLEMMMTVVAGERAPANRAELMQLHRAIGMVRDYLRSTGRRQSAATRLAAQ